MAMHPERRALQIAHPKTVAEALSVAPGKEQPKLEAPTTAQVTAAVAEAPLPVGLLFPGQGSQYVKMMSTVKDLPAVQEMLEKAKTILGFDVLKLCLEGPESK